MADLTAQPHVAGWYSPISHPMSLLSRIQYYQRIFSAYAGKGKSQLTFWHDTPEANASLSNCELGDYYMDFSQKADYTGYHDPSGIPMLDYHGKIGVQYNPIAIAQWGLGNRTVFLRTGATERQTKALAASDWLCSHLEENSAGVSVWNHHFDWEYRDRLKAPWHSGLAQGQGISLLIRAFRDTGERKYFRAAERAFASFQRSTTDGGVAFVDAGGDLWFEEYLVSPPTHILNGFIWALWGVLDYHLATGSPEARELFAKGVQTLRHNLPRYDLGFWSLYEQSGTRLPMVASAFYHRLHIVQLHIMHELTKEKLFVQYADQWQNYAASRAKRMRALCYKSVFKLFYY